MQILTNEHAPYFISAPERLQHERSREIVAALPLEVYDIYAAYAAYKGMRETFPDVPYLAMGTHDELALLARAHAGAVIVYSELSLRERVILLSGMCVTVPFVLNGQPESLQALCTATVRRNGISPEYFAAVAQNCYQTYRAFIDA
jgi:hypothetical protein